MADLSMILSILMKKLVTTTLLLTFIGAIWLASNHFHDQENHSETIVLALDLHLQTSIDCEAVHKLQRTNSILEQSHCFHNLILNKIHLTQDISLNESEVSLFNSRAPPLNS